MAKRKKQKRSRRRIGAINTSANGPLVKYGSIAAGYFLSNKVNDLLDKVTGGKIDSKIVNGVLAAGGLYYLFAAKGKKGTVGTMLAGIAAGTGTKGLLVDFGVISGFRSVPVIGGYKSVPVIGQYAVPKPAAGLMSGVGAYRTPSVMGRVTPEDTETGLLRQE